MGILVHKDLPCPNCGKLWNDHSDIEFEKCLSILEPEPTECPLKTNPDDDEACLYCGLQNSSKCPHK